MLSEDKKIKTREQLRETLEADCARYPMSARRILPYLLQISEGAILRRHIVLLRKTEYYTNTGRRLLAKIYYARLMKLQNRYCLHVPVNTCGKGLWIAHVAPVLINGNATVGDYCYFAPMISLAGGEHDVAPTLGDHVSIGIGSLVIGDVHLADGVNVGAGAVVTKSFSDPGITVAGVPARKLGGAKAPEEGENGNAS